MRLPKNCYVTENSNDNERAKPPHIETEKRSWSIPQQETEGTSLIPPRTIVAGSSKKQKQISQSRFEKEFKNEDT